VRTLSFIEAGTGGTLEIGIAYAPDRPDSVRQAQSLKAVIGDALAAGKVTLKARLIPIEQLANAMGIAGIFVIGELGALSSANSALCHRRTRRLLRSGPQCRTAPAHPHHLH
jgi:hypothetical protein